ncbi:CHRD domain-containing protein [Massilia sp. GCM10020059]|uniref:CHRD domain-containing protein n=1 Tax=Massilia agrisoli TaxID=2892444 RepID=A0ABS8IUH9_9BURK|nr:CHRD domain-containing protein [Massilia agrisoli]MCC6071611.1 CHRD domain-containing protein [Massilia agrisoli]
MKRFISLLALALAMVATPAAFADTLYYRATMSGPAEAPPNASPGYGVAFFIVDDVALTMSMNVPFFDLLGTTTAAHIHCCTADPLMGTAGVATATPSFPEFPSGVTTGLYERTFSLADASFYNPAYITANGGTVDAARAALLSGLASNQGYFNIHTSQYPGGEIRGFLVAAPIPEPSTWGMLVLGIGALGLWGRRRRT